MACGNSGAERAALDDEVGIADEPPIFVTAQAGNAQIRSISTTSATLWAQAPEVEIEVENAGGDLASFDLIVLNTLSSTAMRAMSGDVMIADAVEMERQRPTERQIRFPLAAGQRATVSLRSEPSIGGRYRFAVMGDIQTGLNEVREVFDVINDVSDLEFVLSTGDIVEAAKDEEYELFDEALTGLEIPFYSTIGNHELKRDPENWHRRYGRYSIFFMHRGVAFSFIDSGNASVHPDTSFVLEQALEEHRDRLHLVGSHYPPFDPVGGRSASFRSRKEASAFLARLADGRVDGTFYGHIHSFYAYSNAGIPAFISGGGGATPERWDGVGRHFLIATVDSQDESLEVGLVRVD